MNTSKPSVGTTATSPGEIESLAMADKSAARTQPQLRSFVIFVVALSAAFGKQLVGLVALVAASNLHSYILLVPVISLYLLSLRRNDLPQTSSSSPGLALIGFLAGSAALLFAITMSAALSHNDYLAAMALAFFSFLISGGFFFMGRNWMAAAAFPLAFLFFIIPMPDAMATSLEEASKLASTEAANLFFNLTGTPVLRDRTIFQLPNITIQVSQECSGIRSSVVLILTSLVGANLFLRTTWRRAVLLCLVIPLGVIRNGFRVWVIATLCIHFGPQMAHSIIHRRGGPFFFVLSLIPLFLLLWWLRRNESKSLSQVPAKLQ
jgi:exosortase C (VPDSG-CTERM-specific)